MQQLIRNCTWSQIPQAKEAADDIRILFFAGYMSQSAPAQHPEGQDEVGDGEREISQKKMKNTGT